MQITKSDKDLKVFTDLCIKFSSYDSRYFDLTLVDGCFKVPLVESAYLIFLMLTLSDDDSSIKKAYNSWRTYHHGESRRIYVFFNYVDSVLDGQITKMWHTRFGTENRNIEKSWELLCRIYIVWGVTAQKAFNQLSVPDDKES